MMGSLFHALTLLALAVTPAEVRLVQVAPASHDESNWLRSAGRERAVVLIHGLHLHPFSRENVTRALLRDWQKPGSLLVRRLAEDSDVYSFAYAQNVPPEAVAEAAVLAAGVRRLRQMGYRDVVLVGHSAGGLIARQFVEDHPDSGVTKVIQVCAPNGGSSWALFQAVRANQVEFLESLTKATRQRSLQERAGKKVPPGVQFACLVGTGTWAGDGLVLCRCQWTEDLQEQGIPAYPLAVTHWLAVRSRRGADLLARLAREPQPRWDADRVATVRRALKMSR
jgi:pimeloyl-ACP methyl ester carboxylesterase